MSENLEYGDKLNQGINLMKAKNYEKAREWFEEVIRKEPRNIEAYKNLGNAYVNLGMYEKATECFNKVLLLDADDGEALFNIGSICVLEDNEAKAVRYFNQAEGKGYGSAMMYDIMSGIFLNAGDVVQAIRCINKALQIEPLNGLLYVKKVTLYINARKYEEALETLEEFQQLLPDALEAYDLQAQIYTASGEYGKALDIIDNALQRFPEDVHFYYLKIRTLIETEQLKEALSILDLLKTKGQSEEETREFVLQEATIYSKQNDLPKTIQTLEEYDKKHPNDNNILFVLLNAYMAVQQYQKVNEISSQMRMSDLDRGTKATVSYYYADSLKRLGKTEEAKMEFKKLSSELRRMTIEDAGFQEGYIYRVLCHKELEEYDKGLELAEYVEAMYPDEAAGPAFKYAIYDAMGDKEKAAEEKKKVKMIDPRYQI